MEHVMIGTAITHLSLGSPFYPGKYTMMFPSWTRGTHSQHQELPEYLETVVVCREATLMGAGIMTNCHMAPAVSWIAMWVINANCLLSISVLWKWRNFSGLKSKQLQGACGAAFAYGKSAMEYAAGGLFTDAATTIWIRGVPAPVIFNSHAHHWGE